MRPFAYRDRWISPYSLLATVLGCFYDRHMGNRVGQSGPDGLCIQFGTVPRHDLGAYYTPKALVVHIVQQALRPILDAWEGEMQHLAFHSAPRIWTLKLQNLRVLDHAMGSGRFLCETVNYIVSRAVTFLGGLREKDNNASTPSTPSKRIYTICTHI